MPWRSVVIAQYKRSAVIAIDENNNCTGCTIVISLDKKCSNCTS